MVAPSAHALVCDLLGGDPDADSGPNRPVNRPAERPAERPDLAEAVRRCPRGAVVPARDGEEALALVVLEDGRAYALPDTCPHDGGVLSDGFVEAGRLVCSRHHWEFDPESGRCLHPRRARIPSRPVSNLDPGG